MPVKSCFLVLVLILSALSGRRISDLRPLPGLKEPVSADSMPSVQKEYEITFDFRDGDASGIDNPEHAIRFSGFDKGLLSSKESFFVTNRTQDILTSFTVEIVYRNLQDEMLHSRTVSHNIEIPSGETRRVDIPSWDIQKQFYYFRTSPLPKRQATPFKVTMKLKKASFRH